MAEDRAVTAVVGRFDPLVGHGLAHVLNGDPMVRVIASGLDYAELERTVVDRAPEVAVLDETAEPIALAEPKIAPASDRGHSHRA